MIRAGPLNEHVHVAGGSVPRNITYKDSFMRKVAGEKAGKGKSGPMPHGLIVDEYHEHDSDAHYEFYRKGMKSRRQPMALIITNSGVGFDSPCGKEHIYAERVLEREIIDESYFAYVCGIDKDDKPHEDETVWPKANPSLPVIPSMEYLREEVQRSKQFPGKKSLVDRLNFCKWVEAESPWLDEEEWFACEVGELTEPDKRSLRPLYLGLDLSKQTDFSALCALWDMGDGSYESEVILWTPEEGLYDRSVRDMTDYVYWHEHGYIRTTPGKIIDYQFIAKQVSDYMHNYYVVGLAYDAWRMKEFETEMEKMGIQTNREQHHPGLWTIPHSQGFAGSVVSEQARLTMPRSIDAAERLIYEHDLRVLYNPAVRQAIMSTVVIMDASENRRLNKLKTTRRIDAAVALIQSCGFAAMMGVQSTSPFDDSGFRYDEFVEEFF